MSLSRSIEAAEEASTVPLVVSAHQDRVAFASFAEEARRIEIEICTKSNAVSMSERIVGFLRPTIVLLPARLASDQLLLGALTTKVREEVDENETPPNPQTINNHTATSIPYRVMKSSSFDIRACKSLILQLRLPGLAPRRTDGRHFAAQQSYQVPSFHAVSSMIDLDCGATVQAVGCLISFVQSTRAVAPALDISEIRLLPLSQYLHVPPATMSDLHVFATEYHPLGKGTQKEGFSLFSLLDRTNSRGGRTLLREWMRQPLLDLAEIGQRQDGVELFMQLQGEADSIRAALKRVGAVPQVLARLQKCAAQPTDYGILAQSLAAAKSILGHLNDVLWKLQGQEEVDAYRAFVDTIMRGCNIEGIDQIHNCIHETIDVQGTLEMKTLVVRAGFNEYLDLLKNHFDCLDGTFCLHCSLTLCTKETLAEASAQLVQQCPQLNGVVRVLFVPQVRCFMVSFTRRNCRLAFW